MTKPLSDSSNLIQALQHCTHTMHRSTFPPGIGTEAEVCIKDAEKTLGLATRIFEEVSSLAKRTENKALLDILNRTLIS